MKFVYFIILSFISLLLPAQQSDFYGLYSGTFKHGKFKTDIEFDIKSNDSAYTITFNSLSQNAFGIPTGDIHLDGNSLKLSLQSDLYRYDFDLTPNNKNGLSSVLTVDNNAYNFDLIRINKTDSTRLKSKDIRFRSGSLLLYGTIYYPEDPNGKAIYLVTSSGDQDRSASRAEAMLFANEGYISFHIDKRGTGISDGNWELATIPELCKDDLHALEFLHQAEQIDYSLIGIKGSSQGATKIPYLLKKQPKLAYGIVVSCPASTLLESDLNYWKNRNLEKIGGENIEVASIMQDAVFQYIASNISKEELQIKIKKNEIQPWFHNIWIPDLDQVEFDKKLNYTPLPYFKDNSAPMLVIQGSKDEIITLNSLDLIEDIIGDTGNKKNRFTLLKNTNHAMMMVEDSDFKYWQSLHPKYMPTMLKWIKKL